MKAQRGLAAITAILIVAVTFALVTGLVLAPTQTVSAGLGLAYTFNGEPVPE